MSKRLEDQAGGETLAERPVAKAVEDRSFSSSGKHDDVIVPARIIAVSSELPAVVEEEQEPFEEQGAEDHSGWTPYPTSTLSFPPAPRPGSVGGVSSVPILPGEPEDLPEIDADEVDSVPPQAAPRRAPPLPVRRSTDVVVSFPLTIPDVGIVSVPPSAPVARTVPAKQDKVPSAPPELRLTPPPPATSLSMPAPRKKKAWWDELFGETFAGTLDHLAPHAIEREVDFIERCLAIEPGAAILDLACGEGAHAIELARRQYQVVGYDLSLTMLARAADDAQEKEQKLNLMQGDMRELSFEETFDAIYCWNSSFGYFDDEQNVDVLRRIRRSLRPRGAFLLDICNRDYVATRTPSQAWFQGDGCVCMDDASLDFISSRLKVKRTALFDDGRSREIQYSMRAYSLHELGRILHECGFKVLEVTGHLAHRGVFLGAESPRILLLAERGPG